ncbi:hypothetical protein [Ramlibacter sp. WS9]|uniref:hypothetical protein n=1 Tax=Ramlibacter sp. WS9 TaxID=1882741 RepID=UPI0011411C40|nr:hypothetical protein [Ramlibacter sp. WS9]ROZ71581.1 hypothetical protein EEB15_21350 [Ramlibacter sp. WS9]
MQTSAAELQRSGNQLPGMIVLEGELSAATGDDSDSPQLKALVPVLNRLRGAFGMDMVFIGQLSNGHIGGGASSDQRCNPFEEAYGRELLEARCGTSQFDAVAVFSQEGIEAGTLVCGVTAGAGYQPPPDSLKSVSRLLATTMRRMTACA